MQLRKVRPIGDPISKTLQILNEVTNLEKCFRFGVEKEEKSRLSFLRMVFECQFENASWEIQDPFNGTENGEGEGNDLRFP